MAKSDVNRVADRKERVLSQRERQKSDQQKTEATLEQRLVAMETQLRDSFAVSEKCLKTLRRIEEKLGTKE